METARSADATLSTELQCSRRVDAVVADGCLATEKEIALLQGGKVQDGIICGANVNIFDCQSIFFQYE